MSARALAEKADSSMHIVLCFDDNFWAPAYATMRSVCIASHRPTDLDFHLFHSGLSEAHRRDLDAIETEYGARLHDHDLDAIDVYKTMGEKGRYLERLTSVIYARLMLDEILPEDITRVLYMDCDMYVRAPIEELFEMDLEGKSIAAVREPWSHLIVGGRDLRNNLDLFDLADLYFNSGLIVIDRARWKAAGVVARFEAMIADGTMDRLYYDQDVLNLIFHDDWKRLDQMWNVINPRGPHEAFDPKLLHYTGPRKPWNLISGVAFARVYRHVMTNDLYYRFFRFRLRRRLKRWLHLK